MAVSGGIVVDGVLGAFLARFFRRELIGVSSEIFGTYTAGCFVGGVDGLAVAGSGVVTSSRSSDRTCTAGASSWGAAFGFPQIALHH